MPGHVRFLRSVVAVAATVMLASAASWQPTPTTILLDDLSQHPSARPSVFQVTSHVALTGLRWDTWGGQTATATGTVDINTCRPTCASGRHRLLHHTHLQVRGVRIDAGQRFYRQYRITGPALTATDRAAFSHWTNAYVPGDFR